MHLSFSRMLYGSTIFFKFKGELHLSDDESWHNVKQWAAKLFTFMICIIKILDLISLIQCFDIQSILQITNDQLMINYSFDCCFYYYTGKTMACMFSFILVARNHSLLRVKECLELYHTSSFFLIMILTYVLSFMFLVRS